MPLTIIAEPTYLHGGAEIDIVAVHDILTPITYARSDTTSFTWLQTFFPYRLYRCRVISYSYDEQLSLIPSAKHHDGLESTAIAFAKDLVAERQRRDVSNRPLIFVCHGLGGILVKLALYFVYSQPPSSSTDFRSLFSSTYGILFAGTPHQGIENDALQILYSETTVHPSQLIINLLAGSLTISDIASRFESIMHNFRILNIWEELTTSSNELDGHIVTDWSAAPKSWHSECHGIAAGHVDMLNFNDDKSPGYLKVLSFMERLADELRSRNQDVVRSSADSVLDRPSHKGQLSRRGHVLEKGFISGGNVHLGDVYIGYAPEHERSITSLQQDSNLLHESGPIISNKIYIVPRTSTPQFTGRRLLVEEIQNNFETVVQEPTHPCPKVIVIHGLGGSGKTQVCLRFAERNRSRYWGVFWIDVSTRENAEAGFAALGMQAGRGNTFSAGKYWLSQQTQSWLLILDNADEDGLEISEYLPPGAYGHVLITTRNRNVSMFANVGSFRLQGMDPEEAVSLLLKTAYPSERPKEADSHHRTLAGNIAAELGYLAIALDHAGAAIRRKIYTIERYLHIYLGYRHRLLNSTKVISADETNIVTTWEIPFQKIERNESIEYQDAVTLMHIYAYLHCSSIPEKMFHVLWSTSEEDFCSQVKLPSLLCLNSSDLEEAKVRLRRAISILHDYSIIEHDAKKELCSLHPVVHRWARTRAPGMIKQEYWLDCTLELLARCISPDLEVSGRKFRRLLLPHIESCLQLLQIESPLQHLSERMDQLERFARVYAENGMWKPALSLQMKIIDYRTRKFGKWHEHTLRALRNRAEIHWNLFDVAKALEIQERIRRTRWWLRPALTDWINFAKPDHVSYCVALDNLAQSLWLAQNQKLSKQAGERAVAGLSKRLGDDDPLTVHAMFNLGRTCIHTGNLRQAHQLLSVVLRKRRAFWGSDHPETLMAKNELGVCFLNSETNLAVAEKLISDVLQARRRVLGEEHAYTLWSVNDLSRVLCKRGRCTEAGTLLEMIVPIVERTLGKDHVGMIMTKGNLARTYVEAKQWQAAEGVFVDLLSLIKDGNHTAWIEIMSGYSRVYLETDRLIQAVQTCEEILQRNERYKVLSKDDSRITFVERRLDELQSTIAHRGS